MTISLFHQAKFVIFLGKLITNKDSFRRTANCCLLHFEYKERVYDEQGSSSACYFEKRLAVALFPSRPSYRRESFTYLYLSMHP